MTGTDEAAEKKVKKHHPRNYQLPGGIWRYSRSAMYARRALYKRKKGPTEVVKKKRPHFRVVEVRGTKNGSKRVIQIRKTVSRKGSGVFLPVVL